MGHSPFLVLGAAPAWPATRGVTQPIAATISARASAARKMVRMADSSVTVRPQGDLTLEFAGVTLHPFPRRGGWILGRRDGPERVGSRPPETYGRATNLLLLLGCLLCRP